ncbi:MAG: flagellar basal body P-ring protein FlgI [Pseudomonadota bacterium]
MAAAPALGAPQARIKDLVEFEGVRGNDLVGYGLVVGLNGSGDSGRNAPFMEEALGNLLERLGVNVAGDDFRPRNVAAVIVTAEMPPFARAGSRVDVTVSAVGDADNLLGGTLVMTPLVSSDGEIYAVAQGPILSGGALAEGDAAEVTTGVPTAGTLPGGARIEREIPFEFSSMRDVNLALRNPDFTTASRIERAVNRALGRSAATMLDSGTVALDLSHVRSPAHMISRIENLTVAPAQKARVVIDQRSGTIVLGSEVKISSVAVSQGNLTIQVNERPVVVQPSPFSETGDTVVVPRTDIQIDDGRDARIGVVEQNATLADLVQGLNALGVGPRGMIDILKAIKAAGALHAEFVIQ